jgi:hypothetical protein
VKVDPVQFFMRHAADIAWACAVRPGKMPAELPAKLAEELAVKDRVVAIFDTGVFISNQLRLKTRETLRKEANEDEIAQVRPFVDVLSHIELALTVRLMGSNREREIVRLVEEVESVVGQNSLKQWIPYIRGEGPRLGDNEALGPLAFLMQAGQRMFEGWFRSKQEPANAGEGLLFFLELERRLAPVLEGLDERPESPDIPNVIGELMGRQEPRYLRAGLLVLLWRVVQRWDTGNLAALENIPPRGISEPLSRLQSWFRIKPTIAMHTPG